MFLIVSGGQPPGRALIARKAKQARRIIAADAGARVCLENGITPDLVVGDMDSLGEEVLGRLEGAGVPLKTFDTDKDRTDTEIAFDEAVHAGASSIELLGALGMRTDHAIANIHLLLKAQRRGVPSFIVTDTELVFVVDTETCIESEGGHVVSFLPLTDTVEGIVLDGFLYPLEGASMEIGRPYGVSNVLLEGRSLVSVGKGALLGVIVVREGVRGVRVMTRRPDGAMVCADR